MVRSRKGHSGHESGEEWGRRVSHTVAAAVERFESDGLRPPQYRPKSISTAKNALRHIVRVLGAVEMDDLGPAHARAILAELERTPSQANTCIRWLSRLLSWSAEEGLCEAKPGVFRPVRRYREEPRTVDLTPDQVRALYQAIVSLPDRGLCSVAHSDCLRVLAVQGMRRTEATHLSWAEVSFGRAVIDLPASRNKSGRRKLVPLADEAMAILRRREAHRDPAIAWVFPGRDPRKPVYDLRVPLHKACEIAGIDPLCLHQLRHAFATLAASVGRTLEQIAPALGHASVAMTARYTHSGLADARHTVDAVAEAITGGKRGVA